MKTHSKHSGRIEVKPALRAIQGMKDTWAAAYQSACKHDNIPSNSKFTVFSDNNPFTPFVDKAYTEYCNMIAEYQTGGYVGLKMEA